ncbi:glucans biosynthesis glucosyltransferase MdoH [Alphaproteobacteria bacterium KMM 3653]|uniref:Glucans biosynthesis glucosyltransferase H n=1 Tax=Harenicola maris TaxID=2841044 RepID=A0AAP2CQQ4_9RHOB|nr:glucans biosynthesis glucosyltransferase MdoH [Harenicola maris]
MTTYAASFMPPKAPLEMAEQTFAREAVTRQNPPRRQLADRLWRTAAFVPTILVSAILCLSIGRYLLANGLMLHQAAVLVLVTLTFLWLTFSVNTAVLGALRTTFLRPESRSTPSCPPADIALIIPIYNEAPWDVFGNASATLKDLIKGADGNRYALFVLSDTTDAESAVQEERAFAALAAEIGDGADVYYRRRRENTDKKIGNIADWVENWGGAYEGMVVLDADSLMSASAIRRLSRALISDPGAGLIQSHPMLIGARTLFGRVQQFSNAVYGWLMAEGMASWSQQEGNYWGHNAIIRTRAFASSARLPYLQGRRGQQSLILSHDFIEAGMLRRAGWTVKLLPDVSGSFEETPQTLIDYILRDRRWCHGNMQHLRLLRARGFHMISRLHMLQGALSYLMSPAWLALVVLWSILGSDVDDTSTYFSAANPLMPIWPERPVHAGWVYLFLVYGMLLFPKAVGAVLFGLRRKTRVAYGNGARYVGSILFELLMSVLYAPIMMIHHTIACGRAIVGKSPSWVPQNRGDAGHSWGQTLRFHWVETLFGTVLLSGILFANVSVMILPIAISLVAAVPLSKIGSKPVIDAESPVLRLDTPHTLIEPRIIRAAREQRAWIKDQVINAPTRIAAE